MVQNRIKQQRQARIEYLLENKIFQSQGEIQKAYIEKYDENISQTTLSRDLEDLDYIRDPRTKQYVLKDESLEKQRLEDLQQFASLSSAVLCNDSFESFILKCDPSFVSVICSKIELLFPSVMFFPGLNGAILICISDKETETIDQLTEIFSKTEE